MKNYQKPVLIADDVLSESVYMASGDADCWTIAVSKDQADAGGYATFRIQANHATNLQHISKATTQEKKSIHEIVHVGDKLQVEIIEKDEEKNRLSFAIPNLKAGQ